MTDAFSAISRLVLRVVFDRDDSIRVEKRSLGTDPVFKRI